MKRAMKLLAGVLLLFPLGAVAQVSDARIRELLAELTAAEQKLPMTIGYEVCPVEVLGDKHRLRVSTPVTLGFPLAGPEIAFTSSATAIQLVLPAIDPRLLSRPQAFQDARAEDLRLNGADADALVALLGKQSITLTNYYVAGGGDPAVTAAAANMMAAALAKRLRALNDSRVVEARATVVPRSPPSIPDVQLCAGSSPKPEFPTAFASQAYLARGAVPVEDAPEAEVGKVREYLKNAGGIVIAYRKIDATMGAPVGNFTLLEAPPANTGPRSVEGEKVVNGTFVKEGAMPWAAAFMRVADDGRLEAFCGGTLISSNWVLTAAHCEIEDNSEVIIGRTNLAATNGQVRKVKRSWRHVAFRRAARFDSDIALVQLSSAVGLQAAKLADGAPAQNAVVIVAGWGVTEEGGRTTQLLGSVDLNVEPQDTCEFQYANTIATVTDNMFCASKFLPAPKDACQGDSGGGAFIAPGTRPFAQVGIVSYGKGCATPGFPGVYTKLAPFRQWMDEVRQATGVQ